MEQQQLRPETAAYEGQVGEQLPQWQADRICAAASAGDAATLEAIVTGPDASNCRDSQRCLTPLHWTCLGEDRSLERGGLCAALLLARGASPNAKDGTGCTPLHYAARYNAHSVCDKLLTCRLTRPDLRNHWGRTALMFAAWGDAGGGDRAALAKSLLAAGASVDVRDSRGRTALMWAALTGKLELMRLLLQAGADWQRRNLDGRTACQLAEREGHAEAVRLLLAECSKASQQSAPSPGPEATTNGEGGGVTTVS